MKRWNEWINAFEGGDEQAFSPAMLEVQSAPPAPLARWIALSIGAGLLIFLLWSIWADFDVTISASGTAIPSARTKVVQSVEGGRVTAIHVKDGDQVRAGQTLIALDATLAGADRQRLLQEAQEAQLDVLRLQAQMEGRSNFNSWPKDAPAEAVQRQRGLLAAQVSEQQQKLAVLNQETARKRAELAALQANLQKTEQVLPMLQQRLKVREDLFKEGFVAELTALESRVEVASQAGELKVLRERVSELQSALNAAQLAYQQTQAEYQSRVAAQLTEAQRRWQTAQQELVKATHRESYQQLTSPIDGVVQQLAVTTVGGVVNPAQALMTVVPQQGGVEVEAKVLNKDIGFLRRGQPVMVKLDAFEYTKYGALRGEVQWIGADAVKDEHLGLVFPVRVVLKETRLPTKVGSQQPEIHLGMSVSADVAIGTRKAYEFFLGPLLRYKNESLRER